MISYVVNVEGVSRTRFSLSPLSETVLSFRVVSGPLKRQRRHRAWIGEVWPRLHGVDFRPLCAVIPAIGYIPDFLTPAPASGPLDFAAQLEIVRGTSAAAVSGELAWMASDPHTSGRWSTETRQLVHTMIDKPEWAIKVIVGLLHKYWKLAVEPNWASMSGALKADVRDRMSVIEYSGAAGVFSSLNERVCWDLGQAEDLRAAVGDFVRRARRDDHMPQGQAAVLGYLDRTGPMSIADLARLEQVKHQSMTRTVNLLSDDGLVALAKDDQDRRQVVVTITAAGQRALGQERHRRASRIARAIGDDLTDEEREIVRRLPEILRKLHPGG